MPRRLSTTLLEFLIHAGVSMGASDAADCPLLMISVADERKRLAELHAKVQAGMAAAKPVAVAK